MAVTFGFFNAIKSGSKYDRTYTAENFCDYLGSLVCNGIQKNYGNDLQVIKSSGLTVQVKSGKAWIDRHYLVNSEGLEIDLTGVIKPLSGYYGYAILCAYCDRECAVSAARKCPWGTAFGQLWEMCLQQVNLPHRSCLTL
ncbi:MAG: hypothetical protein LUF89_02250 [Ruminococcus sp.]|nr:hypothetical protein [Ruminococcus sp.]